MAKKILKVKIKHEPDYDADISWLGSFGNKPESKYAIEHKGDRHSYPWFNPSWENYEGNTEEEIKQACQQDYERACEYGDSWSCVGVIAEATVLLNTPSFGSPVQTLHSGGIWGVETDSAPCDFKEHEEEQLDRLRDELTSAGFSKTKIDEAFAKAVRP